MPRSALSPPRNSARGPFLAGGTRSKTLAKAATLLRQFMAERGMKARFLAKETGIPESTLRYFLRNGNSASAGHKRGPYRNTFKPLLDLDLPDNLHEAIADALDYEGRVLAPTLRKKKPGAA